MAAATPMISVTDSALLFAQLQRALVFKQTITKFDEVYSGWEADSKEIEAFGVETKNRSSNLQHESIMVPSMLELITEREGFLKKYWDFQDKVDRISAFASHISSTIQFITPEVRSAAEERRLVSDNPEFFAQLKKTEEIRKDQVTKLAAALAKANDLKGRVSSYLTGPVGWAVQRFCQIVDNNGKPISSWTRGWDALTTPVVPKHNPLAIEEAKKIEQARKPDLTVSVMATPLAEAPLPSEVSAPPSKEAAAQSTKAQEEKKEPAQPSSSAPASSPQVASAQPAKAEEEKKETEKPASAETLAGGAGRVTKRVKSGTT